MSVQLAAGGTAFSALYYSLYGRQLSDTSIDKGSLTEKEKNSAKQWAALERETQNTTAQAWGLPGPPTPAVRRSGKPLSPTSPLLKAFLTMQDGYTHETSVTSIVKKEIATDGIKALQESSDPCPQRKVDRQR